MLPRGARTECSDGERMGRESRFLLALLGLLAGVFVAALSLRLFVPRPPRGTGPDIHTSPVAGNEIVPPPVLSPSPAATAPWSVPPDNASPAPSHLNPPQERGPSRWTAPTESERLATEPLTLIDSNEAPALAAISPTVLSASAEEHDEISGSPEAASTTTKLISNQIPVTPQALTTPKQQRYPSFEEDTASEAALTASQNAPAFSPTPASLPTPAITPIAPNQPYRVAEDDSWWDIAERAYGDGRFYRSLFAWNRAINPRVTLAKGTQLEIPPSDRLKLAWPQLMPGN